MDSQILCGSKNTFLPGMLAWLASPLVFLPPAKVASGSIYTRSHKADADGGKRDATLAEEENVPGKRRPTPRQGRSRPTERPAPAGDDRPATGASDLLVPGQTCSLEKALDVLVQQIPVGYLQCVGFLE